MAELVAAPVEPVSNAQSLPDRFRRLVAQPAVRSALPALAALALIVTAAMAYLAIAAGPQRILYANLTDGERAEVAQALESGGIAYDIDAATGMITVAQDDVYRARMLVASDSGLAAPQGATDMLDSIPLGASRTMEGERLRLARERELMLTIEEIDGVEGVRVHLATPERSVFVRDKSAPSASVMVRLARGRSLGPEQVEAIVNLVAGSVPGLASENVRVVDQNGRLLSAAGDPANDGLGLQRDMEAKMRDQLARLLVPLLGEGNFSTEVQVELDRAELTSARESYEREGALRAESETSATRLAGGAVAGGIPGVLANTPPAPAVLEEAAPGTTAPDAAAAPPGDNQRSFSRNYELGREVAVTSQRPGGITRVSVAVAINAAALEAIAPAGQEQIQALVEAAVGADAERGDLVSVVAGTFEDVSVEPLPFYEEGWFWGALRAGGALVALLLILLLGVRPLLKKIRAAATKSVADDEAAPAQPALAAPAATTGSPAMPQDLAQQVELARQLAANQPDRALAALQRMLASPPPPENAA